MTQSALEQKENSLANEVDARCGTSVNACFQCHKCSTGCPIAPEMDFLPSQVMRLIHLNEEQELLEAKTIWRCASCEACTTRCPMSIDIAGVMDALRIMAVQRNAALADQRARRFHCAFLANIKRFGRIYEIGLMAHFKLQTMDLFSDLDKLPKMLTKRKLALLPHSSGGKKEVKEVFRRAEEEERKR
jgi:heterodisulfide reductase subunit C